MFHVEHMTHGSMGFLLEQYLLIDTLIRCGYDENA